MNENQRLDVHKESDANSLVQRVCEYVTIKLNAHEIEYYIQCVSCTCPLEKSEKQKILKCHKSSNQKTKIGIKRRNSYAQLEPANKNIRLDKRHQHYKKGKKNILSACAEKYKSMDANEKQHFLTSLADKYRGMDANEKQNLLTSCAEKYRAMDAIEKQQLSDKKRQAYQNMESKQKEQLLAKKRAVKSNAKIQKATVHNDLDSCLTCFQKDKALITYVLCVI